MKVIAWETIPDERVNDLVTRRMVVGENEMVVRWNFRKGGFAGRHSHPHEQIVMMVSGRLRLGVADDEAIMIAGDIVVISPNVPHEAEALEDTIVIDIFSPPREDFLSTEHPTYLQA